MEDLAGTSGAQTQEARKALKVFDGLQAADIPFDIRLEIGREEILRPDPGLVQARVKALIKRLENVARRVQLVDAERQQVTDVDPSRKGLGDAVVHQEAL